MTAIGRGRRALADLAGAAVLWMPGRIGCELRLAYYRARGARIGHRVRIEVGVMMDGAPSVVIGDDTWIDRYALVIAGMPRSDRETRVVGGTDSAGRVVIGRRCHIGPHSVLSGLGGLHMGDDVTASAGAKIYSLSHHYRSWSRPWDRTVIFGSMADASKQSMLQGPVVIGSNVGLGVDVLVMPGTEIGGDSFVRPRSTVSGRWPENSILQGDPATRSGPRFPERSAEHADA